MKYILSAGCLLLAAVICLAQVKPKPVVKPPAGELKKLLTGTGLPYKIMNDSIAVIPYEGENIASYNVVVQKIGDLLIIYTNLTEALPGKIDTTKYKYLLEQNDNFDIVKIGMSSNDNIMYVRADLYKAGSTTAILTRIIKQVANVTNIIAGELK